MSYHMPDPPNPSPNLGAWDEHYVDLTAPAPYGDDTSYKAAADWVKDCRTVEDWGCGKGWLRRFVPAESYRGIDGSASPFTDQIADLTTYRSNAEGIVLRHVLEHNHEWSAVLDNALASFTKRLFIALFTPLSTETRVLHCEPDYGDVPVISFCLATLLDQIRHAGATVTAETVSSGTFYGVETLLRIR